jgi:hypothetical protein
MSFLPEEDQEFLDGNGLQYELLTEKTPEGTERRGVLLPGFAFVGDLRTQGTARWLHARVAICSF